MLRDFDVPFLKVSAANDTGLDRLTTALLLTSLVLAVLHHTDHVLRYDHSGWPFRDDVTTFTYSLFIYPLVLFALLGPARLYWLRWALIALGTGFVLYAHTVVETPAAQFGTWAHNHSTDPGEAGAPNLLNVTAPGLGAMAVVISMVLNLTAIAATLSMLANGLRRQSVLTSTNTRAPTN